MTIDGCFMNLAETLSTGARCDIFSCLFGLRPIHTKIYFYLVKNPEKNIKEIAEYVDRDRTTVVRIIKGLIDQGLVKVEVRDIPEGSVRNIYKAVDQSNLKERLKKTLYSVEEAVYDLIEKNWENIPDEYNLNQ